MAILIASTTESQAALDHAASDNWNQPFVEPAAPEPETAGEAEADPESAAAPSEEESEHHAEEQTDPAPATPEKKSRMARVYDRLDEQHQTIEALKAELSAMRGNAGNGHRADAEATTKPLADDPRPDPKDDKYGSDYEKFVEDLADWKYRQNVKAERSKTEQEQQREHAARVMREYNSQIDAVRQAHADYDEVMTGADVQIPAALQVAILEAPNGAEIAYHLLKNPEVAQKLSEMSLAAGAVEIGRLSHMLKPTQQQAAPAKRKPAPLPAPVKPPAAQAATQSKSLAELPYQEFKRRYNAGER